MVKNATYILLMFTSLSADSFQICLRSTPAAYESVRSMLDSSLGYPDIERRTLTAIPPSADLPSDADGLVYLAVGDDVIPQQALAGVLLSGEFEQVPETVFRDVFMRFIGEVAAL